MIFSCIVRRLFVLKVFFMLAKESKSANTSIDINCMKLIVSMLTTRFESAFFQETEINFWDIKNRVPKEIADIYSELGSLVKKINGKN